MTETTTVRGRTVENKGKLILVTIPKLLILVCSTIYRHLEINYRRVDYYRLCGINYSPSTVKHFIWSSRLIFLVWKVETINEKKILKTSEKISG